MKNLCVHKEILEVKVVIQFHPATSHIFQSQEL